MISAVLVLPIIIFGVVGATKTIDNDVRNWLPSGYLETDQYDAFVHQFERDDVIVVGWPDCTLADDRLDEMGKMLVSGENKRLFQRVISGRTLARELVTAPFDLPPRTAIDRLHGVLLGDDLRSTAAVCVLTDEGASDRPASVNAITQATQEFGISLENLHLGGPTIDQLALEAESRKSLQQFVGLSALFAGLVAWLCLGQFRLTLIVLSVSLYGACASLGIVYFAGTPLNLIMIILPTLVYVLGLSGAIHLVNYYWDAINDSNDPVRAPYQAVVRGWAPCCLASLTTGLGLISLLVSDIRPVEDFGWFSGVGVMTSLFVMFLLLPSALQIWPPKPRSENASKKVSGWLRHFLGFGQRVVLARHRVTIVASLAVMLIAGWSLQNLKTTVSLQARFSEDSRVIKDYRWLEDHVGPLVPMEVVLRFSSDHPTSTMDRLRLIRQVSETLNEIDEVGGTLSASTFTPTIPKGGGVRSAARRAAIAKKMTGAKERFIDARLLHIDSDGVESWRISARVKASNSLDYGRFIQDFKDQVEPFIAESQIGNIEAIYTGVIPLIYKAQRVLFRDLFESFLTAFVVIFFVILVIFRHPFGAFITMAPNIFPAVVIFGGMTAVGFKVDLGCMVTASVAMGIAVDDTMHFLTWFRRGTREGMSRTDSIKHAYQHCGLAMIQTTLICGLGLFVFQFSSYNPTKHFAETMILLLLGALVGDLVFLPAILRSRLGRFLKSGNQQSED